MRKKRILKILLIVLVGLFIMLAAVALLLAGLESSEKKEAARKAAQEAARNITPTAEPTTPPSATPTPRPTATPTPVISRAAAFNPDDYWDSWYSTDGTATVYIWDISLESVSFTFTQMDKTGAESVTADVTAKVAGNAAQISFSDSYGNYASGNITFDNGQLYVNISTGEPAASLYPNVNCIMSRAQVQLDVTPSETPTPTPEGQTGADGDYILADSSSRYLTEEDLAGLSADQLELAKNEIYARHGRQFVTDYIAEYFNSKSWYQGTVDPDTFDANQNSIFNEYELANIMLINEAEASR